MPGNASTGRGGCASAIAGRDWGGPGIGCGVVSGVAGVIGEAAGRSEAAVGAMLGAHEDQTDVRIGAMFKAFIDNQSFRDTNPLTGSTVDFGMDLYDARSGYTLNYSKADIRLGGKVNGVAAGNDVCIFRIASAPVDGTSGTGAGNCGPGSILIRTDAGNVNRYQNTNTLASPTWTAF